MAGMTLEDLVVLHVAEQARYYARQGAVLKAVKVPWALKQALDAPRGLAWGVACPYVPGRTVRLLSLHRAEPCR